MSKGVMSGHGYFGTSALSSYVRLSLECNVCLWYVTE